MIQPCLMPLILNRRLFYAIINHMKIMSIKQNEIKNYQKALLDFYTVNYQATEDYYSKALENSQIICFCLDEEKIIGACRIISDLRRHGHIVDFVVDPDYRKQGIGGQIIDEAINKMKKLGIKFIGLTCRRELVSYYGKHQLYTNDDTVYLRYNEK